MVIGLQMVKLHRGAESAILDSKKPGLLRVKVMVYQMSFFKCSDLKFKENICFTLLHQRDKIFNYNVQQSKSRK